jgi:hypothetical protein
MRFLWTTNSLRLGPTYTVTSSLPIALLRLALESLQKRNYSLSKKLWWSHLFLDDCFGWNLLWRFKCQQTVQLRFLNRWSPLTSRKLMLPNALGKERAKTERVSEGVRTLTRRRDYVVIAFCIEALRFRTPLG